jgi:hypothetical protein
VFAAHNQASVVVTIVVTLDVLAEGVLHDLFCSDFVCTKSYYFCDREASAKYVLEPSDILMGEN